MTDSLPDHSSLLHQYNRRCLVGARPDRSPAIVTARAAVCWLSLVAYFAASSVSAQSVGLPGSPFAYDDAHGRYRRFPSRDHYCG
jgi:hypothetical protein